MATVAPRQLEIDYWSEGFPPGSPVNNGYGMLSTNWGDLLWAAVTVGRPNRHYVFRHGDASRYEALFRWSLVRMALEQYGPSAYRLRRTTAAKTLDPSEKGAVNYFLGMIFCKLFSARLLDAPWAMHLDVFRPLLNPVLTGRSRPDLIAETSTNEWVALESKGRVSTPSVDAKNKAKQQAERVISINGTPPQFNVGCITYFQNDVLQFFWRDPEPPQGRVQYPIELTYKEEIWRYYYQPVFELIHSHPQYLEQMLREPYLVSVNGLDIEIGIHPVVLSLLGESQWADAKQFCIRHRDKLLHDNYQADGIQVVAGRTWLDRFAEFAMEP